MSAPSRFSDKLKAHIDSLHLNSQDSSTTDFRSQNLDHGQTVKACPFCAEAIKVAAKVCPYCHASQTRLGHWGPYLLVAGSTAVMLAFVGLVCVPLFPDAFRPEGRSFAPYRAQLQVSRTSLERDSRKPEFWLSGYITNIGNYPWRVQELEARLMEGENNLVDVRHADIPEKFVIQPHQEQAFRVRLGSLAFTNSGIVAKVHVQTATDGTLPAKTD
jgi:hypothetical protein